MAAISAAAILFAGAALHSLQAAKTVNRYRMQHVGAAKAVACRIDVGALGAYIPRSSDDLPGD